MGDRKKLKMMILCIFYGTNLVKIQIKFFACLGNVFDYSNLVIDKIKYFQARKFRAQTIYPRYLLFNKV